MIVTADQGPVGFPTSKDGAGFLAPSALHYEMEAGQSEAVPDPVQKLPGRGAYVCGVGCWEAARPRRVTP